LVKLWARRVSDAADMGHKQTEERPMSHALQNPNLRRSLVISLAAAMIGASGIAATHALVDSDQVPSSKTAAIESSGGTLKAQPTQLSGARP